jgi:hypothetical protein
MAAMINSGKSQHIISGVKALESHGSGAKATGAGRSGRRGRKRNSSWRRKAKAATKMVSVSENESDESNGGRNIGSGKKI